MSRSNPNDHLQNPAARIFEWNAKKGVVKWYDKPTKQKGESNLPFPFLLLDELKSVKGYDKRSKAGIWSNEVRNTGTDPLKVKWAKGGTIAEGLYRDIKLEAKAIGGRYTANLYLAYQLAGAYALGRLELKGAGFSAWLTFKNDHKADLYEKAIAITSAVEDVSGDVHYHTPVFGVSDVSTAAESAAVLLDTTLQKYLVSYLRQPLEEDAESDDDGDLPDDEAPPPITDADIPF